ncbi:hypothetical protein EN857_11100 [Mesorhizobium sp. M4B.F.Ca.ET.214.01.1.1]|nr:hypothetical protein EN857_11100 [Mesorhizobium sp. M4B.F.Ca.ET.214.01.1.1]TGQ60522.1 hypothetical protein EN854_13835 [Mesorhizobium sp. M4B.F.Ca.ET.211.01.1.1]TGU36390.1 hypothetical protein EN793_13830 [Mesorhizobium sp. M4B.F.Ca.ET.150.01.1.1]
MASDSSSTARRSFRTSSLLIPLAIGETADDSLLLPVTIRGEVPGRAMRGGADLRVWPHQKPIRGRITAVHFSLPARLALPLIRLPPPSPVERGEGRTTPAASAPPRASHRSGRGISASRPGWST